MVDWFGVGGLILQIIGVVIATEILLRLGRKPKEGEAGIAFTPSRSIPYDYYLLVKKWLWVAVPFIIAGLILQIVGLLVS